MIRFSFIKDHAKQDPCMRLYVFAVQLLGITLKFTLSTPGSQPAPDYKESGKWVHEWYRLRMQFR